MENSNTIIEEIEEIFKEYNILKESFEPLKYPGTLGKDSKELAESDRLITKIRTLINENTGTDSEYYKSLDRDSRKRGRGYLELCISVLKAYSEKLKSKRTPNVSLELQAEVITKKHEINKKAVFVVHGRDEKIKGAIFEFLRSIKLEPIEWEEAIKMTGKPNPHIDEILIEAFNRAQAILVIFSPDDLAKLKSQYQKINDLPFEKDFTGQARPNVLFEAGMAYGKDPDRTVLIEVGDLRPFSDISGRHLVKFSGTLEDQKILANRLDLAGCDLDLEETSWLNEEDFDFSNVESIIPEEEIQIESQLHDSKKELIKDLFDKLKMLFIRLYKSKASSSPIFAWTIHDSIEMQDYFGITARGTTTPGRELDDFEIFFMDRLFKIIPNSATLSFDDERKGNYGFLMNKDSHTDEQQYYLKKFFTYIVKFVNREFGIKIEFDGIINL